MAEVAPPALAAASLGAAAHYKSTHGSDIWEPGECPVGRGWGLGRGSEPWYLRSGEVVE